MLYTVNVMGRAEKIPYNQAGMQISEISDKPTSLREMFYGNVDKFSDL